MSITKELDRSTELEKLFLELHYEIVFNEQNDCLNDISPIRRFLINNNFPQRTKELGTGSIVQVELDMFNEYINPTIDFWWDCEINSEIYNILNIEIFDEITEYEYLLLMKMLNYNMRFTMFDNYNKKQ